ncbi:exonuclease SbcCD subunit D [Bacteroides sedimenti]|uniref:exonuclease SbcCD subunit D n=1 Tax=Bacteroides sedimenti TaxID=2136147 RepID=UPI0033417C1A
MKLIHTADWHIGQTFFDYNRKAEHLCFLAWLRNQLREQATDVLLIAGDVFDTPNPSAESQKIFYQFLHEITSDNPSLQVVIIAGNHDSAARLEAPDPLLQEMNITVKGVVRRTSEGEIDFQRLIVPLIKDGQVEAWCMVVPYLRQGDYPEAESYPLGVKAMYDALLQEVLKIREPNQAIVAMGHLHAAGGIVSEEDRSERTVVGGVECVTPDTFSALIAYTALGHLHRGQQVCGREEVRYAGAPLPMSFAEKNYKQSVALVEIEASAVTKIERLYFDAPVKLLTIPDEAKPMEDVLQEIARLPEGEITENSSYLEVKVLITEPEPSFRFRIEEALKDKSVRLARLGSVQQGGAVEAKVFSYEELQKITPMEIARMEFEKQYGGTEMPETMKQLLQSVIQEIEHEDISD